MFYDSVADGRRYALEPCTQHYVSLEGGRAQWRPVTDSLAPWRHGLITIVMIMMSTENHNAAAARLDKRWNGASSIAYVSVCKHTGSCGCVTRQIIARKGTGTITAYNTVLHCKKVASSLCFIHTTMIKRSDHNFHAQRREEGDLEFLMRAFRKSMRKMDQMVSF